MLAVTVGFHAIPVAAETAPPFLSADHSPPDLNSTYGSGNFGAWQVDAYGLPYYRYDIDQNHNPIANQEELVGANNAWHQVGNDHVIADAYNHGWVQLWSQDRLSQWMNHYDAANNHFTGGFGYLNVDGRVISNLYDDRPAGSTMERDFGVGYYARKLQTTGTGISDVVYAPFGNDPVLLHDVTISNRSAASQNISWFEYWDVNPYEQGLHDYRGLDAPSWNAATSTLTVAQTNHGADRDPLSIFSAALGGGTAGHETTSAGFFGAGSRALPAAVAGGHLANGMAAAVPDPTEGSTMMALQSNAVLAPGESKTLHYVYGYAHPAAIAPMVARLRASTNAFGTSARAWAAVLPKAIYDAGHTWLARELTWDAYLLRSATVYEEGCGYHTITQGGYYQYDLGANLGYRSWLHYILPINYMDPPLAREILLYSSGLQPVATTSVPQAAQLPYGMVGLCTRFDLGTSNDLDFWLLLGASEYGLSTRDTAFFDRPVNFYMAPTGATVWDHLKIAFAHQEASKGPHGGYLFAPSGATGDWSDLATEFSQMSETMLVTAQTAYTYPRLAALADLRGDAAFAAQLRTAAASNVATLQREWTGKGWFSRGYHPDGTQIGKGVIFEEPQPWALLAGAASPSQAQTLASNIARYLDGKNAPAIIHGPARIGTALGPAANDPGVTETYPVNPTLGGNNAVWPGSVWFDPNGWLTWAYGALDGVLPGARDLAFSEYTRNSLATHAAVFPNHWDGITSVDDLCQAFFQSNPEQCGGAVNNTNYQGQITEQPTWLVMNALNLGGITATKAGYDVSPHLPMATYSLRFPQVGLAVEKARMRGYVTPQAGGGVQMSVRLPPDADPASARTWANGVLVDHSNMAQGVVFNLPTAAGAVSDWAVTWSMGSASGGHPSIGNLPNTSSERPAGALLLLLVVALAWATRRRVWRPDRAGRQRP
ncbi:MAG: GH36-type glycosyl hydrolase domain-containing protein [Candidatus Dormibacteria bacterium]